MHKQLTVEKREELAIYASNYSINKAAKEFSVHFSTAKRWHDRLLRNAGYANEKITPLVAKEHDLLKSLTQYVGKISLSEIKKQFSLPYSIDTLADYYRKQNIPAIVKYLLILKCPNCGIQFRAINVFFGRPRSIPCPNCTHKYLERVGYLRTPFFNPNDNDFLF